MSRYSPPVSREDPDDRYDRLVDQDAQERLDVEQADLVARYFDEFVFAPQGVTNGAAGGSTLRGRPDTFTAGIPHLGVKEGQRPPITITRCPSTSSRRAA